MTAPQKADLHRVRPFSLQSRISKSQGFGPCSRDSEFARFPAISCLHAIQELKTLDRLESRLRPWRVLWDKEHHATISYSTSPLPPLPDCAELTMPDETARTAIRQLEVARHVVLADATHYAVIIPGILPIIGPHADVEVRRWGADFLAEAFASPLFTDLHAKEGLAVQVSEVCCPGKKAKRRRLEW